MAKVATPYGFYPRRAQGSRRFTSGGTYFPVEVDNTATIYWGAPCRLIAGGVQPLTATPNPGTPGTTSTVGVLSEAIWADECGCMFHSYLPTNAKTLYATAVNKVGVLVMDDPDLVWMVQANATLTLADTGKFYDLVNVGAGNTGTISKRSTCALDVSTGALTAKSVRLIRVLDPGAPYPDCLVQFAAGSHQYDNNFAAAALAETAEEGEAMLEEDRKMQEEARRLAEEDMPQDKREKKAQELEDKRESVEKKRLEDWNKKQRETQEREKREARERQEKSRERDKRESSREREKAGQER